jgi:hypothetical protein
MAFTNPSRLSDFVQPVILKQKIIECLTNYNDTTRHEHGLAFTEPPGFLALCWNDEERLFKYPSFKTLMDGHWFIDKQDVIDELMDHWKVAHPTSDIPCPSHTD